MMWSRERAGLPEIQTKQKQLSNSAQTTYTTHKSLRSTKCVHFNLLYGDTYLKGREIERERRLREIKKERGLPHAALFPKQIQQSGLSQAKSRSLKQQRSTRWVSGTQALSLTRYL